MKKIMEEKRQEVSKQMEMQAVNSMEGGGGGSQNWHGGRQNGLRTPIQNRPQYKQVRRQMAGSFLAKIYISNTPPEWSQRKKLLALWATFMQSSKKSTSLLNKKGKEQAAPQEEKSVSILKKNLTE